MYHGIKSVSRFDPRCENGSTDAVQSMGSMNQKHRFDQQQNRPMFASVTLHDAITGGVGIATGFILGLCTNLFWRRITGRRLRLPSSESDSEEDIDDSSGFAPTGRVENHKLVLCVRTDLKMQRGKIAAQVGHATLGAYKKAAQKDRRSLHYWEVNAQPKIALQIKSFAEARSLEQSARSRGLVTYMVYDAGRTQVAAVSIILFHSPFT